MVPRPDEEPVDVHIRPIGDPSPLYEALRDDGWSLTSQPDGSVLASHPAVTDQASARERLDRLGLLTSNAAQIEFRPGA
jgi:hypothetical protein